MKARVKATGEIISLDEKSTVLDANPCNFNSYEISELEILYENTNFPKDYWEKLLHQYAGMAMQSYVSNNVYLKEIREMCKEPQEMRDLIADLSILLATTIVQKLKEKEERK
jgi:hypothetical protein